MGVALVSTSTRAMSNSSDTVTLTKPSGTADGDLLLVGIGADRGSVTLNTVPSGWTELESNGGSESLAVYYKVASSEGASWDWVFSGNTYCAGIAIRVIGNFDLGTYPIVSTTDSTTNNSTPTYSPGVTPNIASSLLAIFSFSGTAGSAHTSQAITTNNPTWTERIDTASGNFVFSCATAIRPETTATGDYSLTVTGGSASTDSNGVLLSIGAPDPTVNLSAINIQNALQSVSASVSDTVTLGLLQLQKLLQGLTVTGVDSKTTNRNKNNATNITNRNKS